MKGFLYIVATVFVIGWSFGFYVFRYNPLIHLLLIVAIVSVVIELVYKKEV